MNIRFSYLHNHDGKDEDLNSIIFANPQEIDSNELMKMIDNILVDRRRFIAKDAKVPDCSCRENELHAFDSVHGTYEPVTDSRNIMEFIEDLRRANSSSKRFVYS